MNWERMKSFLIVLFVGINIFLIGFMLNSVKNSSTVSKTVVADTTSILSDNNIYIDSNIIPLSTDNPGSFEVMPVNVNFTYTSKVQITDKNAKSEIKKALKSNGIKNNYIITRNNDGSYCIGQKAYGHFIFDSLINATCSGNTITLTGRWYTLNSKPVGKDGEMLPVTSVLIEFMNNPVRDGNIHNCITSITIGYCVPGHDSGADYISMTAVPCYSINLSNGVSFLYEASTGAFKQIR
ncbi:MAG: hypothetical protein IKB50_01240 [Clostridia bacterium]|nr:hypothetical protein [Clostridia bacterium]